MAQGTAALAMLLPVVMTALVPEVVATRPLSLDSKNVSLLWTEHNIPPDGSWRTGRATWYGGPTVDSALKRGSCGYGELHNKFVTAINTDGDYDTNLTEKCGYCYEVKCVPGPTRGKSDSDYPDPGCRYPRKAVVVKVTDSCPCEHPIGGESNSRWCCGDTVHFDLSYKAFESIAYKSKGVVDLEIRKADCAKQGTVRTVSE